MRRLYVRPRTRAWVVSRRGQSESVERDRMITVPEAFQVDTIAREGEAGRTWLGTLPDVVDALLNQWHLALDGPITHGYLALIAPVRRGTDALILKISWIDRWTVHEGLALRAWAGRGAVQLIEHAPERGALLLERADAEHSLEQAPLSEALSVAGTLLRRLAVAAPVGVRSFAEELEGVASDLRAGWTQHGKPFASTLLNWALHACEAGSKSVPLLVNIDQHYGNILRARREPWLVIDPKVVAGDVAYGVAPLLWSRFAEIENARGLASRLATLVEAAELDVQATRRWALVRILEYWVWALGQGLTEDPQRCRQLVEWLTGAPANSAQLATWP